MPTRCILTMEQCLKKSTATNKTKKVRVIPGYHLTLGITVTMLSLIVLIPLASVMVSALKLRPAEFWSLITKPTVRHAFATSIGCSFIAALINPGASDSDDGTDYGSCNADYGSWNR